jgi:hypothetical protein
MPFICFCTLGRMIFICITEPAVFHHGQKYFYSKPLSDPDRHHVFVGFADGMALVWT